MSVSKKDDRVNVVTKDDEDRYIEVFEGKKTVLLYFDEWETGENDEDYQFYYDGTQVGEMSRLGEDPVIRVHNEKSYSQVFVPERVFEKIESVL